ncbi:dipeptidyl-peptidase 3 family protein [Sodaliphilus sp.]|uniref:dipeptidyl-peptidase 3 family protein n=1 Tax=Sodaliphilus sp. TaxID=2815818 RepID=UPI0038902852
MKKSILAAAIVALSTSAMAQNNDFNYVVDRFADIQVLRYEVPGFNELSLNQKKLVYFLHEAALQGRDILTDQNCKYNLQVRQVLEQIYVNYKGDRNSEDFKGLELYLKQVWFGNGIHHHYGMDKFEPKFSINFFVEEYDKLPLDKLPIYSCDRCTEEGKCDKAVRLRKTLEKVIFDPTFMAKKVNQADGEDLIATSATNLYEGVTQQEVEDYFNALKDPNDETPISYGLNTKVVKEDGKVVEKPYKVGGLYSEAIVNIIYWLQQAVKVTENSAQRDYINRLIDFYTTGSLKTFDEYSIMWAEETKGDVDFINGFIESYGDPLGMTGSWEAMVNFRNKAASRRTQLISENAQWFENNSPVDSRFKKENVKGVSAKVITAAILAGDSYPSTPIGINLPNSNWIRAAHGSKSVTLENITDAYDEAAKGSGMNAEFAYSEVEIDLMKKYLSIADKLHTDLHECLGHASGKLLPGVDPDGLKSYSAALEEGRADLFALYYLADPKLVELGIFPNNEVYKAEYYKYIMNGLMTQLVRIEPGKNIEESHMRNRKFISEWCYKQGKKDKVIELVKRKGKTYVKINDYEKLRVLFSKLLAEVQRIKSEGDYEAGRQLVENYGVVVDKKLHQEVLARYSTLDIAPYKGFVNPMYHVVKDADGNITDITITYDENYVEQMLRYSRDYSPLTNKK